MYSISTLRTTVGNNFIDEIIQKEIQIGFHICMFYLQIDGLVQEKHNSITNALELRLSCTSPSKYEGEVDNRLVLHFFSPEDIWNQLKMEKLCHFITYSAVITR